MVVGDHSTDLSQNRIKFGVRPSVHCTGIHVYIMRTLEEF